MKTVVTLSRIYKKEVKVEIDPKELRSMDYDQIHDYLMESLEVSNEEELFDKAELEQISSYSEDFNTDRFDIEDESGNVLYGGHL